jgi:hypothetical protein
MLEAKALEVRVTGTKSSTPLPVGKILESCRSTSMKAASLVVLGLSVGACGVDSVSTAEQDENSYEFTWNQAPGTEIVSCYTFKGNNATELDLERVKVEVGTGSHHVHLYRHITEEPVEQGVTDCSGGIDWTQWNLVIGAQFNTVDWAFPEGVTLPIDAHQQFLLQVHWLNTGEEEAVGVTRVELDPADQPGLPLGTAFGVAKDVRMAAGEHKQVAGWLPLPEGAKILAIMGHFHARGAAYQADLLAPGGSPSRIYGATNEQDLSFTTYQDGPVAAPGQGMSWTCDMDNRNGSQTITWGPDTTRQEHCNVAAYYVPGDGAGMVTIVNDAATLSFQGTTGTVSLNAPAGPVGTDVTLEADDAAFLMPNVVHVAPFQTTATFTVTGTTATTVRATTGATVVSANYTP